MDDFTLQVRQIAQYGRAGLVEPGDLLLMQKRGLGGPYVSVPALDLLSLSLAQGNSLAFPLDFGISWNGPAAVVAGQDTRTEPGKPPMASAFFTFDGTEFSLDHNVDAPSFSAAGVPIATIDYVNDLFGQFTNHAGIVNTFNFRSGNVQLTTDDVKRAGAAPIDSPHFSGWMTAPTLWDLWRRDDTVATTSWVWQAIQLAPFAPLASPALTGIPTAPTALPSTNTNQLATTAFVLAAVTAATTGVASFNTRTGAVSLTLADITGVGGAALASPTFTGVPAAPTATPGTNTTQLATCAFVLAQAGPTAGVSSFNSRTGAITLTLGDVAATNILVSPTLTGMPNAPTPPPGTSTTQLATTAFVQAAVAGAAGAGVASFNGRNGAVTLSAADLTGAGGALLASPALTGVPTAPTAALATNSTQLATCAFVLAEIAALGGAAGVASFNSRTGAVVLTAADVKSSGSTAYLFATITPTALVPTVTVVDTTGGVITLSAAHGLATGTCAIITGTVPTGLTANTPYYVRVLSTTTLALYLTQANAYADASRIIPSTATTGWGLRTLVYSNLVNLGFDPVAPLGGWAAHGNMAFELNLGHALAGLVALALCEGINGMMANTIGVQSDWQPATMPTVVSTVLIRYDSTTAFYSPGAKDNQGSWSQQGTAPFTVGFLVLGF